MKIEVHTSMSGRFKEVTFTDVESETSVASGFLDIYDGEERADELRGVAQRLTARPADEAQALLSFVLHWAA